MPDFHYEHPRLAQIYDLDSPWSADRDFYATLAGDRRQRILDLGCGTGLLCCAYAAKGHDVTGVDPSSAMLEVARAKPLGCKIDWVEAFAQTYRSSQQFDLIIMTGHAFQVLLTDEDVLAAMETMRTHLESDGRVAFESRNPSYDWAKAWNYDVTFTLPTGEVTESRRLLAVQDDLMSFERRYRFTDEELVSASTIRFMPVSAIQQLLESSGLRIVELYGDWDRTGFDETHSPEMIFIAGAAG